MVRLLPGEKQSGMWRVDWGEGWSVGRQEEIQRGRAQQEVVDAIQVRADGGAGSGGDREVRKCEIQCGCMGAALQQKALGMRPGE